MAESNICNRFGSVEPNVLCLVKQLTIVLALLLAFDMIAIAQQSELLPEVDVYLKVNSGVRLRTQASNTREGGDPTQLSIGPDLELYTRPMVRLKQITYFDLDDAKSRPLEISAGYRLLATPGSALTNRLVLAATSRFPLKLGVLLSDRNLSDLDWTKGSLAWRYRNRVNINKPVAIHSYHPAP